MPGRDPDAHVGADQVADLLEGLLPAAEAEAVAAHVDGCTRCAAVRADLEALPGVLADAGGDPWADPVPPMPVPVADRIDAALRAESGRRAGLERRAADEPAEPAGADVVALDERRRRVRRVLTGVLAAAAVVVGFVVVGDVLSEGVGSSDDASTAAEGGDTAADNGGSERPEGEMTGAPTALRGVDELSRSSFAADAVAAYASPARDVTELRSQDDAQLFAEAIGACSRAELSTEDGAPPAGALTARTRLALLDGEPVRLIRTGPPERSVVVAYSCVSGEPVAEARAVVDLRNR